MSHKQREFGGRHRDLDGRIERKHGNTRVSSLRERYGQGFAPDFRSDTKPSTVLRETGRASLSEFLIRDR
jgi:hypothetical protein